VLDNCKIDGCLHSFLLQTRQTKLRNLQRCIMFAQFQYTE
jgi:hypothetical protein